MRNIIAPALLVLFAMGASATATAQEMPPMPSTENVQKLSWLVGSFKGNDTFFMEGQEASGSSTNVGSMILQNRYLRMDVTYEIPGLGKMDGMMLLTYNNAKEKYEGFWVDSMSDYTMRAYGVMEGNSLKLVSEEVDDPMMGGKVVYHITYTKNADGSVTMKLDLKMGDDMMPMIRSEMKKG
ncbi:MAG: DUF1579 family protein [Fimbriimonadaceae bacterium]|nr:DUF1579 family protein [Fimbriimonadaceae bacterium]